MTKKGQRLVPKVGSSSNGFTAYKVYEVLAGTGDENLSTVAAGRFNLKIHSENSCNVRDDDGMIRFVTLACFRPFNLEIGEHGLFH